MDALDIISDSLRKFTRLSAPLPSKSISSTDYSELMSTLDNAYITCSMKKPSRAGKYEAIINKLKKRLSDKVYEEPKEVVHFNIDEEAEKHNYLYHHDEMVEQDKDRALFYRAMQYASFVNHLSWEYLPKEFRDQLEEPEKGCGDCHDSYNEWLSKMNGNKRQPLKLPDLFEMNKGRWGIRPTNLDGWKDKDKDDFG